ncbi:enoyl-CoA hydratase [Pyruvatibacter mobilis]|uniref:enoyl-CoA hydratase n=1 Tax=Pyruvatibacter mobilis TaxID=1712261 RepID=UPI003BAAD8DF
MRMSQAAATTTDTPVLCESIEAGIATLTLNRAKARNSLSDALIAALHEAVNRLGTDPAARVIVLEAAGPAFCAGHDLKEMTAHREDADGGKAYFEDLVARCSAMMQAIVRCPTPVIAKVQGIATAAGCQLVASCDLALASHQAHFATPGVNIGLFCSTPMVALSRNVSRKQAMEMLLLGEMIDAQRAEEFGLINQAVPDGMLDEEVHAWARRIASKSSHTLAVGKAAFYDQLEKSLGDAYDYAGRVMAANMMARDAAEGISAFIEKRDPTWEDR